MLRRRRFLGAVSVGVLGAPVAAEARPAGIPRIGWLGLPGQAGHADQASGFREGLRELGYTEGKNLSIE